MTYTPQDVIVFVPTVQTDDGQLAGVWANHVEIMLAYEQWMGSFSGRYQTDGNNELLWRFRQRGGKGLGDIQASITVIAAGGSYALELRTASATVLDTASVSGAGTVTTTLAGPPNVEDDYYELGITRTSGSNHKSVEAIEFVSLAPAQPEDVPAYVPKDPAFDWLQTDYAIAIEHVLRLLNGPGALARDRPHCLFSHFVPTRALALVKNVPDFEAWGLKVASGAINQAVQCGYGAVFVDGPSPRTLHIDAYVMATDATAVIAELSIGGWTWQPSINGWDETTVELSPGWHDITASVDISVADESAVWQVLQVWRS
jgi:hypothetical protein